MEAVKAARQELVALRAELEVTSNDGRAARVHAVVCVRARRSGSSPRERAAPSSRASRRRRCSTATSSRLRSRDGAGGGGRRDGASFLRHHLEPLAWEPSEPFELHLSRGGGGGGARPTRRLRCARLRGGGATGWRSAVAAARRPGAAERGAARTDGGRSPRRRADGRGGAPRRRARDLEADIDGLRAELQRHWGATPGRSDAAAARGVADEWRRAAHLFSDANAVATFSRGSSPRSFAKRTQHAELARRTKASGNQPARGGGRAARAHGGAALLPYRECYEIHLRTSLSCALRTARTEGGRHRSRTSNRGGAHPA